MHIIELRASHFARLRAVEIRPSGPLVRVTGKNSAGKTSVLHAIWTALRGRIAAPPRPIADDAEEAVIELDLGTLKILRRFRRSRDGGDVTTDLSVFDAEGAKVRRTPQAVIDALLGDLTFDPLAFSRLKPDQQFDRLKPLVPGVDFELLARQRARHFDERTEANRQVAQANARLTAIKLPEGPEPEAVNTADVVVELSEATEQNGRRARALADAASMRMQRESTLDEIKNLQRRIDVLEAKAKALELDRLEIEQNVPPSVDTTKLAAKLAAAEKIAETRRMFAIRRERLAELERARSESAAHTEAIESIDAAGRDAVAKAKLPGGLTLDAETKTVLLGGVPFEQAGTAEKITASTEIAIALNPQLRVCLIDEGSELDSERLATLEEIAIARDFQIWVARVEEGEGSVGFRIEDGTNIAGMMVPKAAIERAGRKG